MEKVLIKGKNSESTILIGESIDNLTNYIPSKQVYIITDQNVNILYEQHFPNFPKYVIVTGEDSKNLASLVKIYQWLLESGADRNSFVVGIGGGVVSDIAGFVASTFMRGISFGFVATTLLSQVDASIGGKNGVNLDNYKNIIGTFNLPKFVICDISMLKTLSGVELSDGFAEMIKHCLIASFSDFEFMEQNADKLIKCDIETITPLLARSIQIKADIVNNDEKETGLRKTLNLGHTWGHAIEKTTNLSHGHSVSLGLEFAARLSHKRELITHRDYMRLVGLLRSFNLPVCYNVDRSEVFDALTKDKKKNGSVIDFIFLNGLGSVIIEKISFDELKKFVFEK
ncbi:MAG TPA: 3-dehydroquinate synthase [Salinivirgaceae bacterium]|nr:3-dehydroquinate synthase [Salinivirgaceae bacterium]